MSILVANGLTHWFGKEVALEGKDPKFIKTGTSDMHISWPLTTVDGTFELDLGEKQVKMRLVSTKTINWFFDLNTAERVKLPFESINNKSVDCRFENMKYSINAEKGFFSKPGNGSVWRISPQLNTLIVNFADTGRR